MDEPKKQKPRKARIDSIEETLKIIAQAGKVIEVPPHMRIDEFDKPFFRAIIDECANVQWSDHKVQLAVILARDCADLEYHQYLARKEGPILRDDSGRKYRNPRVDFIKQLQATIVSLRRSLGLHTVADGGNSRETQKRREIALHAQKIAHQGGNISELIPRRG